MVPVPSDSETAGRAIGSNSLQISQNVDTLSDQCASLLAEVQVLQQKEMWATECEQRQSEVIRHESQIHEVMTAHLQELYSDDKITRSSLNQVTQSRDLLLGAAQDLQAQLDRERIHANQRIVELGEAAARSSTEAIDQILRLGHQEVYSVISERDNLKSELMMTINKSMINEDEFKQEAHQLRMRASTLQYEGIEEMMHARSLDELNRRKIQNLSEEKEDFRSRFTAQESFITTLRNQLREANEELGRKQTSTLSTKPSSSSSADHRMAEMKMNILEENIQRKDRLTEELHKELLEAKALEAQLRTSTTYKIQASGSQSSTMNEDMVKLRAELHEEAAKEDVPRPFPYGTDELGDDKAHPIDTNYLVTLQFDLRIMKNIRRLATHTMDTVCFASKADVLRKFDRGERHDALGNRWPFVPPDSDTGYPRRLKRSDLVGNSNFDNSSKPWVLDEYHKVYKFMADVIHPMVITAFRCGLSARYLEQLGAVKVAARPTDPSVSQEETRAKVNEKLEYISSFVRRLIKKTFGASRYSYYQKPDNEETANYKFIDISPAIIDEKRASPCEILIACRHFGIPIGYTQKEKMDKFEESVCVGKEVPDLNDYLGYVTSNYLKMLKDG